MRSTVLALLLVLQISTTAFASQISPPNIIIVMVDDMGYSDLGCYGGEIETPHIDSLAENGLRFTQFYNTARCCPTRAALLTGQYQHAVGIGHMTGNSGIPSYQGYLNNSCVTIAEALGDDYYKYAVGKWHVGGRPEHWPLERGFDRYYGTPSGGGVYEKGSFEFRKTVFFVEDDERVELADDWYVTDDFGDHAVEFIEDAVAKQKERHKPFFMYLAHIAPHWPLIAKPQDIAKYKGRYDVGWDAIRQQRYERQLEMGIVQPEWKLSPRDPQAKAWEEMSEEKRADLAHRMAVYAAQIDCVDQNMGRMIKTLKKHDIFDHTLILFLSDNGCSAEGGPGGFRRGKPGSTIGDGDSYASVGLEWANAADTPFRKFKMSTHEGGIATPLIAHWPNGISRKGELERTPVHVVDLLPTCISIAHNEYPTEFNGHTINPAAGTSLWNLFNGHDIQPRSFPGLYWEHEGNRAVRSGDWKLVAPHKQSWELYNLKSDRTELNNLAADHPEKVEELKSQWKAWATANGVQPWPIKRNKKN